MIRPKPDDFLKLARPEHLVAVVKQLPSDVITPVDAYYATGACYLLESAEKGLQVGRYSFLGVEPVVRIEIRGEECLIRSDSGRRRLTLRDPLRVVGETLKAHKFFGQEDLSPFLYGAVGYVGYDMIRRWEAIPAQEGKPGLGLPDAFFQITRFTLIFDNLMHTLKIACNVAVGEDPAADYEKAVADLEAMAAKLQQGREGRGEGNISTGTLKSSFSKEKFQRAVTEIKDLITQGEAIQVVLSQRINTEYEGDPFLIYRALRSINPSPYMFYLNCGDFTILGASPEVMVKVEDGRAMLRPIAGTRPRGKTIDQDMALKNDLLADEKEQAEHLMLVDLARNDLGRIAVPGTVTVDRYMEVEMYSHVMHIVSEVSARLAERMDAFDVIKAVFPAGTVSGAPKVRAMEIIEEMEPVSRGPYAGLVGYLSYTGMFDSCITIRSLVVTEKKLYLQAGAGIVYDSEPDKEYQETLNKARALLSALQRGGK